MDISQIMSVNALLSHADATSSPTEKSAQPHAANNMDTNGIPHSERYREKLSNTRQAFEKATRLHMTKFDSKPALRIAPMTPFNGNSGDNDDEHEVEKPHPTWQPAQYPNPHAFNLTNGHTTLPAIQANNQHAGRMEATSDQQNQTPQYPYSNKDTASTMSKAPAAPLNGQSNIRMSEAPSLNDSDTPDPKLPTKGRSFGDKSCRAVKIMRKQAAEGDIQAAIRLGWSVERVTKLFNAEKAGRGETVYEGQPIDDPEIIAQIQDRQKKNRDHQRERAEKLRVLAAQGDLDAAKKAGYGKKRLEEMFPELKNNDALGFTSAIGIKEEEFDFQRGDILSREEPLGQKVNQMILHDLGHDSQGTAPGQGGHKRTGSRGMPQFSQSTAGNAFGRPSYPRFGSVLGEQLQLRAQYEEAVRAANMAQGRVIEATQAAAIAKRRVMQLQNQLFAVSNTSQQARPGFAHKRKKSEKVGARKMRYKNRPSNFPPPSYGQPTEMMDNGRGSTIDEAIEVDD